MLHRIRHFVHTPVARSAVLRILAIILGVAAGIVIARLGGAEVKGIHSAFAAVLTLAFLALNFDIPQQALRMARAGSKIDEVLPWMRRVWVVYAVLGILVVFAGAVFWRPLIIYGLGLFVMTVTTQSGVIAMGTRGPVNYAGSAVVNQGCALLLATFLGIGGVLNVSSAPIIVLASLSMSLVVMWWGAPVSILGRSSLEFSSWHVAKGGATWQVLRSLQTIMLKLDLLWVTVLLGAAKAGVYSVAVSTAMLVNIVPQQVSNQLLGDILRNRNYDWRKALGASLFSGIIVAVPIGIGGWFLVPFVYGNEFYETRIPIEIALVGAVAYGGVQVVSNYVRNLGALRDYCALMLPGFLAMILLLVILVPWAGIIGAATAMAVGMTVSAISGALVCHSLERRRGGPQKVGSTG